jgi:hypothetical protein
MERRSLSERWAFAALPLDHICDDVIITNNSSQFRTNHIESG